MSLWSQVVYFEALLLSWITLIFLELIIASFKNLLSFFLTFQLLFFSLKLEQLYKSSMIFFFPKCSDSFSFLNSSQSHPPPNPDLFPLIWLGWTKLADHSLILWGLLTQFLFNDFFLHLIYFLLLTLLYENTFPCIFLKDDKWEIHVSFCANLKMFLVSPHSSLITWPVVEF